jgi:hypothetical protein
MEDGHIDIYNITIGKFIPIRNTTQKHLEKVKKKQQELTRDK